MAIVQQLTYATANTFAAGQSTGCATAKIIPIDFQFGVPGARDLTRRLEYWGTQQRALEQVQRDRCHASVAAPA